MKDVVKDAHILKWELAVTTWYCSGIITNYFERHPDATLPMPLLLCGITKSTTGNIMLPFKTVEEANRACTHADKWVKEIDPVATTPQHAYAVVAHNAPTSFWSETTDKKDAIDDLEGSNLDNTPNGHQVTNFS